MATAVSEQNNVQQSSGDSNNKITSSQVMHNGTDLVQKQGSNVKTIESNSGSSQRLFGMSHHQYIPTSSSEVNATPGQLPGDPGSGVHTSSPKQSPGNENSGTNKQGSSPSSNTEFMHGNNDDIQSSGPPRSSSGPAQHGYSPLNASKMQLPLNVRPGGPPMVMYSSQGPSQQYLSGHRISQQSGPTPTLNHLLQTSNTMQRMQNCYGPPQVGGPPSSNVPGGGGPNDSLPYSSQNWQHSTGGPHGGGPSSQQSQNTLYATHQGNMPPIPPSPNASNPTSTPQIYGNPSSPFVHRPPQSSTPNTNLPDSVDLAGQNSNDSFTGGVNSAGGTNAGGGGAPGTPNSQGMRPSPSPTGSTGSRSMSPAVGQQNIQMPPRPSSSQSDGSGPTRMSHSPMATQGGYQGPPQASHITGYKIPGGVGGQSTGSSGPPGGPPYSGGPQHPSGPPQSHTQFPPSTQGNYGAARAQGNMQYSPNQVYGGPNNPGGQGPNPNVNNINSAQYSGRSMPNHFPGYQSQPWNPPGSGGAPPLSPNIGGKGGNIPVSQQSGPPGQGVPPAASALLHAPNSQSPRPPPHYLKQHLQHKMGFGGGSGISVVTSHSPPQGFPGMGPPNVGMHHHVGATMGPPSMGGHMGHNISMGPPNIGQSNSHDGGPMPPPSSTPNSHMPISIGGDGPPGSGSDSSSVDNGITTTAASNVGTHVTPSVGGNTVTSVVTTGPDGTSLDEGSQQSTLSNASIASGEDPQCSTPKSRKNDLSSSGGHYSHPTTPQSTVPSPGAASMNSMHADEYDISSPSWPRTPASPVFNSHVPQAETYRSKKSDSLSKLYEMDDSPDRRSWLDKLLAFMEERRTPITTCPTISKNPLDLFRLYLYVKDRGGFMEISPSSNNIRPTVPYSKVTKNKTWKDIAGMLGIGASSSAAYTLRKHYTKNLLAFECKFDRGGIDPQPIINQVEATSKKKGAKSASIPSPGSSNSQDSFPTPGSSGASMDGYGGYGYPPGSQPDYNSPQMQQRPSSQTNAPSPHPNANVMNHQQGNNQTGDNISVSNPFDDGASGQPPRYGSGAPPGSHQPFGPGGSPRPQGMPQTYTGQAGYNQYQGTGTSPDPYQNYPNNSNYPQTTRALNYPPYSPDTESRGGYPPASSMSSTSMASSNSNPAVSGSVPGPDPYNRYNMNTTGPGGTFTPRQGYGINTNPSTSQPSAQSQPAGYTGQPDYYRNDNTNYPGGTPGQTSPVSGNNQVFGNGKAMPPPTTQPRRHPDFAKDQQQYPAYNQQKPQMYGWPNNQYRGQYSGQPQGIPTGQTGQWPQANVPPRGAPPGGPTGANVPPATNSATWGPEHRYPPGAQPAGATGTYPAPQPGQPQWNTIPPNPVGQNTGMRPTMVARPPYRAEGKPPFNMPPPQVLNKSSPASGGMTTSSYTQQPLPKREITFPPDSVEAATAMFYRRKRLTRMDVAPLDAWRIMMSLRSGLLCETTWALDVLNVLLFDDTAVAYFGLAHLPGLLDTLLEHFQRSLTDMFELAELTDHDKPWYELPRKKYEEVDLGAVTIPIDVNDHVVFLTNTPNYSLTTRKNAPVKLVPKDDEIFILDNHKCWDSEGDPNERCVMAQINFEPWQLTSSGVEMNPTDHILTCFQAEFGNVPFVRLLRSSKKIKIDTDHIKIEESNEQNDGSGGEASTEHLLDIKEEPQSDNDNNEDNTDKRKKVNKISEKSGGTPTTGSDSADNVKSDEENNSSNEKTLKKRTKTLNSDVIVESSGDSTGELEKEKVKTEQQQTVTKVTTTPPVDIEDDALTRGGGDATESSNDQSVLSPGLPGGSKDISKLTSTPGSIKHKVSIQDEAGVLKRRRMSDYEDEPFSRDEPSLCLITETQESLGRRCICISTILRNLTFIPGNELEFARNATFLGLLGKLLILHHEHPVRTQKTRNYDREEDADFADSCSSLQGETYWWWDYLMQVRENVLVATANISGYIDLEPYPEEIARPILDGLLHWAVCPSAHGQDPFLSVGPFSMLSPQRLALESLCKLCVTDANVDLVIATPPYSRLERLCSVLTKLLCRSEEQVLREFAVNLLHYLSAASSAMARTIALQSPCVSLLVSFIEQAEQSALGIANQHGIGALRENPDAMGTSLDMLRRAAHTLLHLARHPDNRPLFIQQEQRLLSLAMSQILDQQVANIISSVLFECSAPFSSRRRSMVLYASALHHHDTLTNPSSSSSTSCS